MNRKRTSVSLMVLAFLFLAVSVVVSVPPRQLTAYHAQQFALIPLCAFVAALPGVPLRWFAYFSSLAVAPMIAMFSYQIEGSSFHLGWTGGISRALLPVLIILAVVAASVSAAWLRVVVQKGIGRMIGNANTASHGTALPRRP